MLENTGRYDVWPHCEGHDGRLGGQLRLFFGGGLGFDPEFVLGTKLIEGHW